MTAKVVKNIDAKLADSYAESICVIEKVTIFAMRGDITAETSPRNWRPIKTKASSLGLYVYAPINIEIDILLIVSVIAEHSFGIFV